MSKRSIEERRANRQNIQGRQNTPFPSHSNRDVIDSLGSASYRHQPNNGTSRGSESLAVSRKSRTRDDDHDSTTSCESLKPNRIQKWQKAQKRTGKSLSPESALLGHSEIITGANKAWETVQQNESVTTVTCNGDSEEEQPCTQPATSSLTNAELLKSLYTHRGPSNFLPPRTPSLDLERQSYTEEKEDPTEEPAITVQNSSPAGASNRFPAMLKRKKSEEIEKHDLDQADAFVDVSSKTPLLAESVQDCVAQVNVAANSPPESSRCDSMINQESVLDVPVDTYKQSKKDSIPIYDRDGPEILSDEGSLEGGVRPLNRKSRRLASTKVSKRLASTKVSKRSASTKVSKRSASTEVSKRSASKKASERLALTHASRSVSRVDRPEEILSSEDTVALKPLDVKNSEGVGINDVVCIRGGPHRKYQGNRRYLELVKQMAARYRKSPKEDTTRLAEEIIATIAGMTPPGKFVKKEGERFELADDKFVKEKVKKGIHEWDRVRRGKGDKNVKEKKSAHGCKVEPDPTPVIPHEKDPAPIYIEERAYLFHDPPMPDTGIRPKEQAVTADTLPPLPKAPPVVIPTKTDCKWTFCEESRVLLVNFNGIDKVSPADKRAFAEMLQRDDITVVAEGLLEGINPGLLSLEYMAVTVKDHHRFRRYKRDSSGEYVTYEEKKGHLSMKLSDFLVYLKQRRQALNPSRNGKTETAFSFMDRELKEVKVDVTDPLYLIDMDVPNRLPHLFAKFSQAVKIPEILPGGEWCMTNEVPVTCRPAMGPLLYATPEGAFTQLHQDGHGTVDSGHFCISGYNEVLMLRRLPERHKLHACQMVPGFEKYNPLYDVPHGFEQECPPNWFDVETIEKWRKLGYYPSVFILKAGQFVHINKGRLHAFRKMTTENLPQWDSHAKLRKEVVAKDKLQPGLVCISIAHDWMYTGINSEGINREVAATLECTSLNKHNKKMSLAIPKTAILHIAKALEANLILRRLSTEAEALEANLILRRFSTEDEAEADVEKIKGILPAFRHMVDLDSQVLKKQEGVTPSVIPISSEDLESSELDPFGSYFCKLCHTELFNSFMHCNGCESLLGRDFNLCTQCHQEGTFERFHQMHPHADDDDVSTMNHTGKMAGSCSCQKNSTCLKCNGCVHCSCDCHTQFTYKWRFYTNNRLREMLRVLEEAVKGSEIEYSEETQVRLKLIADREDVEALEAKRKLLDKLRIGAATGEANANANADADAEDVDADAGEANANADADAEDVDADADDGDTNANADAEAEAEDIDADADTDTDTDTDADADSEKFG